MVTQAQELVEILTESVIDIQENLAERSIASGVSDEKLLECVSHVKRFTERWHADPGFRAQIHANPLKTVIQYGIKVDPAEIRPLWDTTENRSNDEQFSSSIMQCCQSFEEKNHPFKRIRSILATLKEPRFKAWRERQIARSSSQFKQAIHRSILHLPVAFELSKGCSVGCPFCGVSAPKLSDLFIYNQENAELWHGVLKLIKQILGSAAGTGFCYWATDPLDNLDYEKFCSDFHKVFGIFPSTTTALSMRNPDRTRSLLKLSREKGCLHNRFSILSLNMLNQVHQEFSPEELAFVSLALQNKESNMTKANAGRSREQNLKQGNQNNQFSGQGTIACVTGFLFNMVDRQVKLISPCQANDRWPLGYVVYDEGNFSDANDLEALLERMIANNMPLTVRSDDRVRFRRDLQYTNLTDGFQVATPLKTFKFQGHPGLNQLGQAIEAGDQTVETIASLLHKSHISLDVFDTLNRMIESGILDDEP
jgi:radical SAM family RiPP maturation amino acid epimerase